jgi:hypothetical protein
MMSSARTAARGIQPLDDHAAPVVDVGADAVHRPAPLLLGASQAQRRGQAVERNDEPLQRGEAPVAVRALITRVQQLRQLHQFCVREACDLDAAAVAVQHMVDASALRRQARLAVPVAREGEHDEQVEPCCCS